MATFVVSGAAGVGAQQIVNAPTCEGKGKCVVIANNSAVNTIYIETDRAVLEGAKGQGLTTIGIPILAGEKIVIPWVTSPIWAINYVTAGTTDEISAIAWE